MMRVLAVLRGFVASLFVPSRPLISGVVFPEQPPAPRHHRKGPRVPLAVQGQRRRRKIRMRLQRESRRRNRAY